VGVTLISWVVCNAWGVGGWVMRADPDRSRKGGHCDDGVDAAGFWVPNDWRVS